MPNPAQTGAPGLIARLTAGDPRAIARAISAVENGVSGAEEWLNEVRRDSRRARVIGFTGAPGVGKSTLINACITNLRESGRRVAVVSIDPSSPLSGGAILGDRVRMSRHIDDAGVFIRSGAARGHLGGLSRNIRDIVDVIDAAGWEVVILETVGTGQSEVEIADIADVCVVVSCPGLGDEIQAMKAGVLDIADVLVVNKADLEGAAHTAGALRSMLKLRDTHRQSVPVVETVATDGRGIDKLLDAAESRAGKVA